MLFLINLKNLCHLIDTVFLILAWCCCCIFLSCVVILCYWIYVSVRDCICCLRRRINAVVRMLP